MKILSVGDVHGNYIPLTIAKELEPQVDKIVFLGDYVDSFENSWPEQKKVLQDIINFKQQFPNKVELLLGNHDLAYLGYLSTFFSISGHQTIFHFPIQEFLEKHFDLFNVVYVKDSWIFSHAGVTNTWLKFPRGEHSSIEEKSWKLKDMNLQFKHKNFMSFMHNSRDPYGNDIHESCMWLRPPALLEDGVKKYNQVVGHTEFINEIGGDRWGVTNRLMKKENGQLYIFIDSPTRNIYTIIDTKTNEVEIKEYVVKEKDK